MTGQHVLLALHLSGALVWVGGMMAGAAVVGFAGRSPEPATLRAARKALLATTIPGMALAWICGLAMLLPDFSELYARAGWMHAKLTLLIALSAAHGVLLARVRKAAGGRATSPTLFWGLGIAGVILAVVVVTLAVAKPF